MKLTRAEARSLVWYDGEDRPEDIEVVEDIIDHMSRWASNWKLIVKRKSDNTFWQTMYRKGATEGQGEEPFEYDDEVQFTQVFPVEKTVTVYEAR